MLGVQVDLVLGAVQSETDCAFSLAAIEVVDEQGLYLMGHRCSVSSLASSSAIVSRHSQARLLPRTVSVRKSA
jgi:hypothetical protein